MLTPAPSAVASPTSSAVRELLETAAALGIPFFKPGYYRYAFADARKERDAAAGKIRTVAALSARLGARLAVDAEGGAVWSGGCS